jgi:hypothetical protein
MDSQEHANVFNIQSVKIFEIYFKRDGEAVPFFYLGTTVVVHGWRNCDEILCS